MDFYLGGLHLDVVHSQPELRQMALRLVVDSEVDLLELHQKFCFLRMREAYFCYFYGCEFLYLFVNNKLNFF